MSRDAVRSRVATYVAPTVACDKVPASCSEWAPLATSLFAVMAFASACGGYRVLKRPRLHRLRTVLVWFVAITIALMLRNAFL